MESQLLLESGFYVWVVLPILIFTARVLDVSLGTVRVIFISRGYKYWASMIGFFEILIWLLAMGQIMKHLSNPMCYIAYGGGFATGNFAGIYIAEKLTLGVVLVRIVTRKDACQLIESLKSANYGVTTIDGHGTEGNVKVIFTIVARREVPSVVNLIKMFHHQAFYSIEEVCFVEKGIFPARKTWACSAIANLFRPFRPGK